MHEKVRSLLCQPRTAEQVGRRPELVSKVPQFSNKETITLLPLLLLLLPSPGFPGPPQQWWSQQDGGENWASKVPGLFMGLITSSSWNIIASFSGFIPNICTINWPGDPVPLQGSSRASLPNYQLPITNGSCTITEKAPTRAFSWLKAATTAFTFKTLLRHYANQPAVPYDFYVCVPISRLLTVGSTPI